MSPRLNHMLKLWWAILIVITVAALTATSAFAIVYEGDDPPGGNSLPPVCTDEQGIVIECPELECDLNNNQEIDAGDLLLLQRRLLGL